MRAETAHERYGETRGSAASRLALAAALAALLCAAAAAASLQQQDGSDIGTLGMADTNKSCHSACCRSASPAPKFPL